MHKSSNFDRILAILCSVLDAYSAVLFLPSGAIGDEDGQPHYVASSFSLGNKVDYGSVIQKGKGLVGWILRNQEPLLVSNYDQRQNFLGYYKDNEEHTIKAFMGCALPGELGALCLDSKRQYSFSEKDQKLLHLFADLIARMQQEREERESRGLIARYYTALKTVYELRRQHSRWSVFLDHFLDLLTTVTGFTYGVLCTRDSDGEGYSVEGETSPVLHKPGGPAPFFPITHGMVGWVFRNSRLVMSDGSDGAPEASLVGKGVETPLFQTVIAVPLVIQRKTRGVLCLGHDIPMEIPEFTKDFIKMAAEHLALFLENLYVKCRLRDLHQQAVATREK